MSVAAAVHVLLLAFIVNTAVVILNAASVITM